MNLLLHIAALKTGGAERQLTYLAKGLAERGHKVHVVTLYQGGKFWDELAKDGRVLLHCLERTSRWDFFVIFKLWRYCKINSIEMMLSFLPVSSVIAALPSKICRIPLIMGIRASNMEYSLGPRLYLEAERIIGNLLAARFVANSYAGAAYHRQLGYAQEKMLVIGNGLQLPEQQFSIPLKNNKPVKIGLIGRLDPMKGIPTLFEAIALVLKKIKVELVIYGEGDSAYKARMQRKAIDLDIAYVVSWLGWVDDVWSVLDLMDLYVSSSYGEGMSNTLMEAMVSGRVIVATDVGDARRMLCEDEQSLAGYIVPPADPVALAEVILSTLKNPEQSIYRAQQALKIAQKRFSCSAMVDQYENLFNELVAVKTEKTGTKERDDNNEYIQ